MYSVGETGKKSDLYTKVGDIHIYTYLCKRRIERELRRHWPPSPPSVSMCATSSTVLGCGRKPKPSLLPLRIILS